jgi:Flp pilus assembly protein TadG
VSWIGIFSRRKKKRHLLISLAVSNRGEEGQSLVEFALVLPLLLLLLLGIIQFGAVFNALITINAAAREGARLMAAESCLE